MLDYNSMHCSGFFTDQKVPDEIRLISGEQSAGKLTFTAGDYVYVNRGMDKGVRVGDRFSVVRPDQDPSQSPWFKWQVKLMKAMGQEYIEAGEVRVVNVLPKVSVAQVIYGKLSSVYVNLGTNQGVKVGDYLRIFRYQGSMADTVPQEKGYQYMIYGFGSAPQRYEWNDLPREILGEGIVISTSRNSSTMMITVSGISIYAGDYVEIE